MFPNDLLTSTPVLLFPHPKPALAFGARQLVRSYAFRDKTTTVRRRESEAQHPIALSRACDYGQKI
jgi:hypothetical protein